MSEKKKVFISGPMSGIKDFNKPAFDNAEQWLTQAGYSVFNPARMHFDDAWTHEEIMAIDLAALSKCDYILMLPKWSYSKGAMQEYHYANSIGVEILTAHNAKPPKKEQNPSQRIEIETFGDISGENIDFLLWFEKHCNEVLAKGESLTGDVDTAIDNLTDYICTELGIKIQRMTQVKKSCDTCKYETNSSSLGRCLRCDTTFNNWEPKDAEK